jgi:hypothetical protein
VHGVTGKEYCQAWCDIMTSQVCLDEAYDDNLSGGCVFSLGSLLAALLGMQKTQ